MDFEGGGGGVRPRIGYIGMSGRPKPYGLERLWFVIGLPKNLHSSVLFRTRFFIPNLIF